MIELLNKNKQMHSSNDSSFIKPDIGLTIRPPFQEFDDNPQEESFLVHKSYHYTHSRIKNSLQSSFLLQKGARWTIISLIFLGRCFFWFLDQVKFTLMLLLAMIIVAIGFPANYCCGRRIENIFNKYQQTFIPMAKYILKTLGAEPGMDEPHNIFDERVGYLNSLIIEEKTLRSGGHQIPGHLTNQIQEAKRVVLLLEKDLCVVPEFKGKYYYTDAERLTPSQIKSLVSEKYLKPTFPIKESDVCSLCIEEFRTKEAIVRFSCQDKFHKNCIAKWLKEIPECPNCKVFIRALQNE